jgi:hypothetical protein
LPEVEAVRAVYQAKGVRFVNVVNGNPTTKREFTDAEITQTLNSLNSKSEVAVDRDRKAGLAFHATSYPTMFVVSAEARIVAVNVGYRKTGLLKEQLDALLAGKPVPTSQPH